MQTRKQGREGREGEREGGTELVCVCTHIHMCTEKKDYVLCVKHWAKYILCH